MARFRTHLIALLPDDERTADLMYPLIYDSDLIGRVEVAAGFSTDFASVPRLFWNVLPPVGNYGEPAVVHDWLYCTQTVSRATADAVLLEACRAHGVGWLTRRVIYYAVRLFGWHAWRKHKHENESISNVGGSRTPSWLSGRAED